jgi:hypothetical protein
MMGRRLLVDDKGKEVVASSALHQEAWHDSTIQSLTHDMANNERAVVSKGC